MQKATWIITTLASHEQTFYVWS